MMVELPLTGTLFGRPEDLAGWLAGIRQDEVKLPGKDLALWKKKDDNMKQKIFCPPSQIYSPPSGASWWPFLSYPGAASNIPAPKYFCNQHQLLAQSETGVHIC